MRDERDTLVLEAIEALRDAADALRSSFAKRTAASVDRVADHIEERLQQCADS